MQPGTQVPPAPLLPQTVNHTHTFVLPSSLKSLLLIILGLVIGGCSVFLLANLNQKATATAKGQQLVVIGKADSEVVADMVETNFTLETTSSDLMDALTGIGIPTSEIDISKLERLPSSILNAPKTYSEETFFVVHLNHDTFGKYHALVTLINTYPNIGQISTYYGYSKLSSLKATLQVKALQDARAQAENIAQINKQQIKQIADTKNLTESTSNYSFGNCDYSFAYQNIRFIQQYQVTYILAPKSTLFGN